MSNLNVGKDAQTDTLDEVIILGVPELYLYLITFLSPAEV